MTELELIVGDGVALPATLSLPPGPGPHAAIVPLHPASEPGRTQLLFTHLAEVLPPNGIAVCRYDRRGNDVPFEEQVADALSAVRALRDRDDIDRGQIGLWGFSQGAWIAPMVAARSDWITFLVLLASTGVSPAAQMRYAAVKHAQEAGFGEDVVRRITDLRGLVEEYQRGRVGREPAQRAVDAARDEPWFEYAYVNPELPRAPGFWPDMDFDPAAIFGRVRVPTLLFYGEDDEWSPIDASVTAWTRAAAATGNGDLTVVRLAGTRHSPTVEDRNDRDAVAPEYERSLLSWLGEHVGRKSASRRYTRTS